MKWFSIKSSQIIIIIQLVCTAMVYADEYHYVNILVGARAAGLGGAYTALADDPVGCFYNPAGIALASSDSFSASMNAYQKSTKTYKETLLNTSGQYLDWCQESSSLLPNFFGVVKKFGTGKLGLTYAVPDATQRRQKQSFNNIQSIYSGNSIDNFIININDADKTYLFGPSYALRINNELAIGTTFYIYYRDKEIIRNQVLQFSQGEHYWINYYENQQEWGYRPMVGVIWEPFDKLALGLTLTKVYLTSSSCEQQTLLRDSTASAPVQIDGNTYDFSDTDTLYLKDVKNTDKDEFPLTTTLGLTYFVSSRLLFSADLAFHNAVDDKEAVMNLALGTEYYLNDKTALRAGFYTDMANTPSLSKTSTNQSEHIDMYGLNLSIAYFHRQSSITLGTAYGFGNGEAQVVADSPVVQDAEIQNLSFFLAASYSF